MNLIMIHLRKNILSILSYPKSALTEIIFMFVNDLAFFTVWYILIERFGGINGWGLDEATLLLGAFAVVFGVSMFFFGGSWEFRKIVKGDFDIYLLRPRSVLLQYLTDSTDFSVLGDLIFGLFLLSVSGYTLFEKLFVVSIGFVVFLSFLIFLSGLALFFNAMNEDIFFEIGDVVMSGSLWPSHTITAEFLRFALIFAIPALLVAVLPIEFLRGADNILLILGGVLLYLFLAFVFWKKGLKRYSGLSGFGWVRE